MEFKSTKVIESKKCPGVSFTIKVMTEGVRTRLNINLAEPLETLRDLQNDIESVDLPRKEDGSVDNEAPLAHDVATKISIIVDRINLLRKSKIDPVYLAECFVSIGGIVVDGKSELTFQDVRENAPEKLTREIILAIRAEVDTTDEETQNLGSPITSAAGADGPTNDSLAVTAESKAST